MAREHARRHQRERITGILLAALGVVVLVVAIIALRSPRNTGSSADARISSSGSPSSTGSTTSTTPNASTARSSSTPSTSRSASSSRASATTAPGSGSAPPKSVPLVVLNNTTISGLAKRAAARFEAGGWTVTDTANLTNSILSTCAYYDPAVSAAKAAAQALQRQYPTIKRVEPRFSELPAAPVVVVLTPDYSAG